MPINASAIRLGRCYVTASGEQPERRAKPYLRPLRVLPPEIRVLRGLAGTAGQGLYPAGMG